MNDIWFGLIFLILLVVHIVHKKKHAFLFRLHFIVQFSCVFGAIPIQFHVIGLNSIDIIQQCARSYARSLLSASEYFPDEFIGITVFARVYRMDQTKSRNAHAAFVHIHIAKISVISPFEWLSSMCLCLPSTEQIRTVYLIILSFLIPITKPWRFYIASILAMITWSMCYRKAFVRWCAPDRTVKHDIEEHFSFRVRSPDFF